MHICMIVWFLRIPCLLVLPFLALDVPAQEKKEAKLREGKTLIRKLPSPQQGGSGYELVYVVEAPREVLRVISTFSEYLFG